jgi:hypothetical protein
LNLFFVFFPNDSSADLSSLAAQQCESVTPIMK